MVLPKCRLTEAVFQLFVFQFGSISGLTLYIEQWEKSSTIIYKLSFSKPGLTEFYFLHFGNTCNVSGKFFPRLEVHF